MENNFFYCSELDNLDSYPGIGVTRSLSSEVSNSSCQVTWSLGTTAKLVMSYRSQSWSVTQITKLVMSHRAQRWAVTQITTLVCFTDHKVGLSHRSQTSSVESLLSFIIGRHNCLFRMVKIISTRESHMNIIARVSLPMKRVLFTVTLLTSMSEVCLASGLIHGISG